ncbi:MAG: ATP-dependent DNA helicase [Proteobacteria bacterium]|nr:MAG: ATP-dependent DNA helicase [Pseudomonadota bacterium]
MRYVLRSERRLATALDLDGELNTTQRAAVQAGGGPILIIAGAGSGKTRTLTYRAARLIAEGLDPRQLLLCTFTNRAAREMVQRVQELLGVDLRPPWTGTFHHVANVALRRYGRVLGLDESYTILDSEDAKELMASCLAELGDKLKQRRYPQPRVLLHIWSTSINRCLPIVEVLRIEAPRFCELANEIEQLGERFTARKLQLNLVDYDDLLVFFRQLLVEHDEPAEALKATFRHVLVDEYQDTNKLQGEIVDLCAETHGNLTVVGDDAQSIYAFRGAHYANIIDFPRRYPSAQVFKLERNYRSVPEVLALANRSIRNNVEQFPKQLEATRPPGMTPALLPLADSAMQAEFVCQRVLELHNEEDVPLGQMAVLYRAHSQSVELQVQLTQRQIPYTVRSGLRFFEQAHIKDVVAYLRVLHNSGDVLAWQRVLKTWSGVGRKSAERVLASALDEAGGERSRPWRAGELLRKDDLTRALPSSARPAVGRLAALLGSMEREAELPQLIRQVIDGHYRAYARAAFRNADTRVEDLLQLADFAKRYESLERFLSELALVAGLAAEGIGDGEMPDDKLTLSTVHQAKGLEWRAVFVLGLAEGRFPQAIAVKTRRELEEERRLFYVAVTRAKDQLYLCHPRFEEPDRGPRRLLRLSRFVEELSHDGGPPAFERWEIVPE